MMKALVLEEYGRFVYKDMDMPRTGPHDVLVKVMACAVCGSDVHGMDGSTGRRIPPVVMGHEASGIIETVGSEVRDFAAGDRVTFDSTVYCGRCDYCREGRINLCDNRRVLGVSCAEYRMDGAFAQYVSVPDHIIFKLPDAVTFEQAAMIEPLSVAYHATVLPRVAPGLEGRMTAAVVGCGNIGLLIAQLLKARGFGKVLVSDVSEEKLRLAKKLGLSDRVDSSRETMADAALRLTGGRGVDLSFDAVGVESSVMDAIRALKKGGECVLVGNVTPAVPIPLQEVVTKQLTLYGSCASSGEYPQCLDRIADGSVDVDALISKAVPLSEGNEWIHRVYNREPGLSKIVLLPWP